MKFLSRWLQTLDWKTSGKWTVLSVLVGIIAGLGGIVFLVLGQLVTHYTLVPIAGYAPRDSAGEFSLFHLEHPPELNAWLIIPVMIVGGLASGWLVYTFAPEAEGHGTDAAIEAFHQKRGLIRARIPFIKTLASALTLGTGGSGGREGPIAQIGAAFGSYLGTVLKLPARDRRILLAAGVGAGIGAIFRAPLAGALFAAEILYSESDLETDVIIPAATASIVGYTVFTLWLPADVRHLPLFGNGLKGYAWNSPLELVLYGVLALMLVPCVAFYVNTFYGTQRLFEKVPLPKKYRPAIGAGLAGLIGVGLFQLWGQDRAALAVLSTGYGTLQDALSNAGTVGIPLLLTVAAVKVVTTSLTISSGGSGGVFGPSMVIGGCIGSAIGLIFQHFFPGIVSRPETFGLVGMAGFFSGCAHAPFSTIIMVSEITGGYGLLLPAMWVSTLTFVLCRPWKLYSKQVPSRLESPAHRGDFLIDVLEGLRVDDIYHPRNDFVTIPEGTKLKEIVQKVAATEQHFFPVTDANGKIIGIFSEDDVRPYLYDQTLWTLANARDIMNPRVISVTPHDDLNTAMRCFTTIAMDEIPVVDAEDRGKLLGTLRHQEAISAYNRRVMEFKQSAADHAT
ncbi:chloride channel protein [Planctomicrobium piriforme]|uniref:Chloride channel protein, CIC family n=1 Tax=Planctomicrobium piriforme TaxID=1576369 RepID=A0A1I3DNC4_9PLAN|nr:chloride channel protein [Planctomicrobium piriforme]SFH88163.1 chloride channel protein, CIC family [Planctomicrobium piriforme]